MIGYFYIADTFSHINTEMTIPYDQQVMSLSTPIKTSYLLLYPLSLVGGMFLQYELQKTEKNEKMENGQQQSMLVLTDTGN